MSAAPRLAPAPPWRRAARRVALFALALLVATALLATLSVLVGPGVAAPPPRSPFGVGFREAAPSTGGLGGVILGIQSRFARALQDGVTAFKTGHAGALSLIGLAFAYGILHAAGPGHGKAVIAGYIVADERALRRGLGLSLAAAFVQAMVALSLVGIAAIAFRATAATMNLAGDAIERVSFAAVALLGAALTWRKSARLADALAGDPAEGGACGHLHLTDAEALSRLASWRTRLGVVLAAGLRPCAGAVLVLVFALTQGVFLAGIAAVFAMALGTAITTGALAALAVFAKAAALRLASGRSEVGRRLVSFAELVAAAFVLALGIAMLSGGLAGAGS